MENRLVVAKGEEEGKKRTRSLELTDTNYYMLRMSQQPGPTV